MAVGAAVLLTSQRKHLDNGEGPTGHQPGDPSLPSTLWPLWPGITGPDLLRQQFRPGQGAVWGTAWGRGLPFPQMRPWAAKSPAEAEGKVAGTLFFPS